MHEHLTCRLAHETIQDPSRVVSSVFEWPYQVVGFAALDMTEERVCNVSF